MASRRQTTTKAKAASAHDPAAVPAATRPTERYLTVLPNGPWWRRRAPWSSVAALVALILVAPAWMLREELRSFWLFGDDFVYIAEARDGATTLAHLLEPHNAHVVPVFRLWTYLLVTVSGRLANLPNVFAGAAYFGLIAAMLATGHFVAHETGRLAVGLSAMAILGISTVTHPSVTWYSAGQALWAGTAIVATLIAAQSWCARGGNRRLVLVAVGTVIAPTIWSGGLIAGPAAIAYLWIRRGHDARRLMALLAVLTAMVTALILALSQQHIQQSEVVWESHRGVWPRPLQALLNSAQALAESCLFGNLGLYATTAPAQAVALLTCLACFWAWTRGGVRRINALELSGATVAIGGCLLAYTFRGNWPYQELRTLGWYHAIPQVGSLLFAAGWWSALSAPENPSIDVGRVLAVLGLVVAFCVIQAPRGEQILIDSAPPFSPGEASTFPSTELRRERALYFKAERRDRQRRALARLDRVDTIVSRAKLSPGALRERIGRVLLPGIPEQQLGCDAFDLLSRPRSGAAERNEVPGSTRAELTELLRPEVPPTPFWLRPDDALSRSVREIQTKPGRRANPQ